MQSMFEAKLYVIYINNDRLPDYYYLNKLKALKKCYELAKCYKQDLKYTGKNCYVINDVKISVILKKVIL